MAPALTRTDLLEALRQRHFFASDDWNADVSFTLNGQVMGSVFTDDSPSTVQVSVSDADAEGLSSLTLMRGVPSSGVAATVAATAPDGATALSFVDAQANQTTYYYAVLVQADGDRIVTSPIWHTQQVVLGTAPAASELALTLFPNPTAGAAMLSYYLPTATSISADVTDALGRPLAAVMSSERQAAGPHTLVVPALPIGLYLVRLLHDGIAEYRKLLVE